MSSASVVLPPNMEPDDDTAAADDDVMTSTEVTALTSAERAATIIKADHITLNTKLAVFTINGTN